MVKKSYRVAGVQMDVAIGQVDENLARIDRWLKDPRCQGVHLVVFPECAITGYCFQDYQSAWQAAQQVPGPATDRLAELAQRHRCYLVVGLLERTDGALYNAAVVVGSKGIVTCYRKTHLPYLGADKFVTRSDALPEVIDLDGLRVGVHICYDGSFPEMGRLLMLDGADVALLPTNWPPGAEKFAELLAPMRALENHYYFMAINRVGVEGGFRFLGQSKIAGPTGDVLAAADASEETILVADVDPQFARNKKIERVPGQHAIDRIADRRPELYRKLVDPC